MLRHQGHKEHTLTLMHGKPLFICDACGEEFSESSYICTICDYKSCVISPLIIPPSNNHHHPRNLVYTIPDMHGYFNRDRNICHRDDVFINYWVYYCHKCTYFAHITCATSSTESESAVGEIEADDESNLVELPLKSEK